MSFNVAISGLNAANKRMEVAGNNIANVGTAGFKSSRAQFSALYAASHLGSGQNAVGSGVRLADVRQNFTEGESMTTTGRPLDMRIQGNGFFVVSDRGSLAYTRAGGFMKDANDYVVDSQGGRLQGYAAAENGEIMTGVRSDLKIDTSNIAPKATTKIAETINLDASLGSLAQLPAFDQNNPATYTRVITRTIQDKGDPPLLPVDHELKQFFVKTEENQWSMFVLVNGRNPVDPGSISPERVTLDQAADGTVRFSGNNQHIQKISDTEFSLHGWRPAKEVNGAWVVNGFANAGAVSLPLTDGAGSALDAADPVMLRPVPVFNPADLKTYSRTFSNAIYDSQGNQHEMKQYFVKDGTNSWRLHILIDDRNPAMPESSEPLTANIVFSADGSLRSLTGSPGLVGSGSEGLHLQSWVPAVVRDPGTSRERWISNGAGSSAAGITIDFNNLHQHNAATSRSSQQVDGHAAGQLSNMSIGRDGILRAGFTNNMTRNIGQVLLASFASLEGLQAQSDTRWTATNESGPADYATAGVGALGAIIGGSLEGSNVELSHELIELIQAQTAYQANSKAISTEVTLLQTLIQST
jgi:flagellar hook protein FlgE